MNLFHFLIFAGIASILGCENSSTDDFEPDTVAALPLAQSDLSCLPGEVQQASFGDLNAVADFIVVGEVTSVTPLPLEAPIQTCESAKWYLKVELAISRELKGSLPKSVAFELAELDTWGSQPTVLIDGDWIPSPPVIQTQPTLGWTGDEGIQVGQDILAVLIDTPTGLRTTWVLSEAIGNSKYRWQSDRLPDACVMVPGTTEFTLAEVDAGLKNSTATPSLMTLPDKLNMQHAEELSICYRPPESPGDSSSYEGPDPAAR